MNNKWLSLGIVFFLLFIAIWFYRKAGTAPSLDTSLLSLKTLDGKEFDWNSLKGKKTILCFGASWCKDCRKELEKLKELIPNELKDVEVVVVSDESAEQITNYRNKYTYPFLFLRSEKSYQELNIYSVPTNYLLNGKLQVVKEKIGDFPWEDPSTRQHLLTLMEN